MTILPIHFFKLNFRIEHALILLITLVVLPFNSFSQNQDLKKIQPFKKGEKLIYRIHYGPVTAGEAIFEVRDSLRNLRGRPHYYLTVNGRTLRHWDVFYKVRDYYSAAVDTSTLLPTVAVRIVNEGKYSTKEKLVFYHDEAMIKSNDTNYNIEEPIFDILSAVYYGRSIDFSVLDSGMKIPVNTFFSDSLFPVGATYVGTGTVKTKLGKFRCYIVKPQLIEGRIFKGQDDMTLYISADRNQVPLRIESAIFVGYIQADLKDFRNLRYPLKSRID